MSASRWCLLVMTPQCQNKLWSRSHFWACPVGAFLRWLVRILESLKIFNYIYLYKAVCPIPCTHSFESCEHSAFNNLLSQVRVLKTENYSILARFVVLVGDIFNAYQTLSNGPQQHTWLSDLHWQCEPFFAFLTVFIFMHYWGQVSEVKSKQSLIC